MMHQPCNNIDTSNNFYDPSRVLEDYYNYSSPSLFQSYPSLHHQYIHGDGDNNNIIIEANFYQDLLENHHEMAQQHNPPENNIVINDNNNHNNKDDDSKRVGFVKINSPRKKISKKDRHTKIDTAQGPRDRRMRLSMNIAKKFFNLQDMLGFDKASQTVEWLLTKSFNSISEVSRSLQHQVGANSSSVSSTPEVVMDELSSSTNANMKKLRPNVNKNSETKKVNKKVARSIRPLAKESRDKARERARERTKEKMINFLKRRELAGTTNVVGNGSSLVGDSSWIPSASYYHNLQENDGIIHELTIPELEHLSGNLGHEANIWLPY
ncbi:hypothetical protein Leryth_017538 [Lithospermum erythrorhizon]|nr:hypothetical protein Leryth_017538 [Lithospermum erythrorhizon]